MASLSYRTIALACTGLATSAIAIALVATGWLGEWTGFFVEAVGLLIVLAAAGSTLIAARQLPAGSRLRGQFGMLGAGSLMFALAGALVGVFRLTGVESRPGVLDLVYLVGVLMLAAAIWSALRGFAMLSQTRVLLIASVALVTAVAAVIYTVALRGAVADSPLSLAQRALTLAYPLIDLELLFAPTMALLMVLAGIGAGRISRPWWMVALAFWTLSLTDILYLARGDMRVYASTSVLAVGWWVAFVLIAVGASMMVDLDRLSTQLVRVRTGSVQESDAGGR